MTSCPHSPNISATISICWNRPYGAHSIPIPPMAIAAAWMWRASCAISWWANTRAIPTPIGACICTRTGRRTFSMWPLAGISTWPLTMTTASTPFVTSPTGFSAAGVAEQAAWPTLSTASFRTRQPPEGWRPCGQRCVIQAFSRPKGCRPMWTAWPACLTSRNASTSCAGPSSTSMSTRMPLPWAAMKPKWAWCGPLWRNAWNGWTPSCAMAWRYPRTNSMR